MPNINELPPFNLAVSVPINQTCDEPQFPQHPHATRANFALARGLNFISQPPTRLDSNHSFLMLQQLQAQQAFSTQPPTNASLQNSTSLNCFCQLPSPIRPYSEFTSTCFSISLTDDELLTRQLSQAKLVSLSHRVPG